jgi:hypothetical protein
MRNFALYLQDVSKHKINSSNPNVSTVGMKRQVIQYKNVKLRKGIFQPWRSKFRKNRLYTPVRYMHRISNKIKEEKMGFSFKAFLLEADKSNAPLDQHGKTKLFSTYHSQERGEARDADDTVLKDVFHKFAEHLQHKNYGDTHKFVVTSKKHDRSVCFDYRKDKYSTNDQRKHLVATTIFPKGQHYVNAQSKGVKVESIYEQDYIYIMLDN